MRQILVAIDGSDINIRMLDFACFFARITDSVLIAALMNTPEKLAELEPASNAEGRNHKTTIIESAIQQDLLLSNRRLMDEACSNRGILLEYVQDNTIGLEELIKESRYSDLIIADAITSFERRFEGTPTIFLKQLLARAECPVLVAPESFDALEEIVFAYDGSESAMRAIRQFTYLFPEFTNRKLVVLQVADESGSVLTEKERLHHWLHNYYTDVRFELLYGRPKDELFGYLLQKEKKLVVMGAFGRTMLSSLLSKSNAQLILEAVNLPVFISHS